MQLVLVYTNFQNTILMVFGLVMKVFNYCLLFVRHMPVFFKQFCVLVLIRVVKELNKTQIRVVPVCLFEFLTEHAIEHKHTNE